MSSFKNILFEELVSHSIEIKTHIQKWTSPEGIEVQSFESADSATNLDHVVFGAGSPPFLRGPYASMYTIRPWTIRQYAGFSTAEESNAFYRRNLAAGQKRSFRSF